jgi:hypothetical protein
MQQHHMQPHGRLRSRNPITGIAACCACAASGHAAARFGCGPGRTLVAGCCASYSSRFALGSFRLHANAIASRPGVLTTRARFNARYGAGRKAATAPLRLRSCSGRSSKLCRHYSACSPAGRRGPQLPWGVAKRARSQLAGFSGAFRSPQTTMSGLKAILSGLSLGQGSPFPRCGSI